MIAPLGSLLKYFFLNCSLYEVLILQTHCIPFYVLYAYLRFMHKRVIFFYSHPQDPIFAFGGDIAPVDNAYSAGALRPTGTSQGTHG